jgi:predicted ATPase
MRAIERIPRIVITGAPGAGKTTLLLALQARGYTIAGDTARAIIHDRRRRGLSPRPDPHAFAQETLRMDIETFVHHAASPGPVFFERGGTAAADIRSSRSPWLRSTTGARLCSRRWQTAMPDNRIT